MGQRARPPLLSTWTLLGCAAALALAVLFWHSLGTVIAGWIVDFFVAVVRLFLALVDLLPAPF
jgi:hypothetical protein